MAETKKCWQCAFNVPAEALVCGHCRAKLPIARKTNPGNELKIRVTMGIVIAGLAVMMIASWDPKGGQSPDASTPALPVRAGAAPIDPGIYRPYTREAWGKTFRTWGDSGVTRIQRLREAAAKAAAGNPACDAVEIADISNNRSTPPDHPVVYVDCRNTMRFYFSENDPRLKD